MRPPKKENTRQVEKGRRNTTILEFNWARTGFFRPEISAEAKVRDLLRVPATAKIRLGSWDRGSPAGRRTPEAR
jgi:hypothetical protein